MMIMSIFSILERNSLMIKAGESYINKTTKDTKYFLIIIIKELKSKHVLTQDMKEPDILLERDEEIFDDSNAYGKSLLQIKIRAKDQQKLSEKEGENLKKLKINSIVDYDDSESSDESSTNE